MHTNRLQRCLLAFAGCVLLLLAAACGSTSPPAPVHSANGSATVTSSTTAGSTPTPSGKPATPVSGGTSTVRMPPTQTSCPQPVESGRAAVMRPLALGSHPSIAYIFNEGTADNASSAELKRYDVTTGSKTVIVHLPQTNITEAQVSGDGQWLLFVSNRPQAAPTAGDSELQLVRMDGQGLQTLFCAPFLSIRGVQWSPDEKVVVFSILAIPPGELSVYLLNLASGAVQRELSSTDASYAYQARTWPDNTRVYVVGVSVNGPSPEESLYLLDTSKGPEQHQQDLQQVLQLTQPLYCWDFDSDYETTRLVTSSCTVSFPPGSTDRGIQQGPSSITVQSITGGSAHTTFTTPTLAITQVRLLGYKSSKLLLMENQNFGASISVDTSQNGLWQVNTDGSGLTRLTTESAGDESNFNRFTQYPWSNVSVDGKLYALQVTNIQSKDPITNLVFGALDGGPTTTFAFAHVNAGTVEVAGWTMM